MKVKVITLSEKGIADFDYRQLLLIEVDGKKELQFCDGEPEDASLGRDFNDCFSIHKLMKKAYEAGKAGEEFELEEVEVDYIFKIIVEKIKS